MPAMFSLLFFCNFLFVYGADPTIVQTEYGTIRGLLFPQENVRVFRSIPYASPPVGDLRWVNPQPPKSWSNTLDCTHEVVGCPQACHQLPLDTVECPEIKSEDCLYVNVWTPIDATPESNLPVLLFIHGGSFWTGYGGGILYNGTRMVNETQNAVLVTINYRLGALGSLYDPSLGLQGNYGYLDQVYAIEWTYRNIKNFGGNPSRLVIFGESAGAHSVALHLLNKTSLIAGGIMESAPVGLPLRTEASWGTLPMTFSTELGCPKTLSNDNRLQCLRSKNASQIVSVQVSSNDNDPQNGYALIKGGMPWTPTVGPITGNTALFIDQPLIAMQKGEYNTDIPWMSGSNSGESFMFIPPFVSYESLVSGLVSDFGKADAQKIETFYNITSDDRDTNVFEIEGNIMTDFMFRCSTRNLLESSIKYASKSDNIGYFYHFNYIASYAKHVWFYNPNCWTHVCHTEELPMIFDPNSTSIDVYPTPEEILASNQAQFYWTNFAQSGNPSEGVHSNDLNVKWTNYESNAKQATLMMNTVGPNGVVMSNAPDSSICDFWDQLGWNWYNGTNNM